MMLHACSLPCPIRLPDQVSLPSSKLPTAKALEAKILDRYNDLARNDPPAQEKSHAIQGTVCASIYVQRTSSQPCTLKPRERRLASATRNTAQTADP